MKSTNVTMLRARLRGFPEAVKHGETVEILDRRTPVARLVPVGPVATDGARTTPEWLEKLRRAGVVRVGPMKGVRDIAKRRPPGAKPTGALDALLDERRGGR